jgi:hypothetical protein
MRAGCDETGKVSDAVGDFRRLEKKREKKLELEHPRKYSKKSCVKKTYKMQETGKKIEASPDRTDDHLEVPGLLESTLLESDTLPLSYGSLVDCELSSLTLDLFLSTLFQFTLDCVVRLSLLSSSRRRPCPRSLRRTRRCSVSLAAMLRVHSRAISGSFAQTG